MTNTSYFANAVVQTKGFALKDAEDIEAAMATSQDAPETDEESATHTNENPTNEETNWKKRHDDLKTFLNKKTEALNQKESQLVQQVTELQQKLKQAENQKSYPRTEEEVKAWMNNYPDLSSMLESIILMKGDEKLTELRTEMKNLEDKLKVYAAKEGRSELKRLHPDADDIESDPRFAKWFHEQPLRIQELITSADVKDIARGLDIYKKDIGLTQKATQEKAKESSRNVNTGTNKPEINAQGKIWKESEIKKMNSKALEKHMPDIEKAQLEGRIDYDLTNNYI